MHSTMYGTSRWRTSCALDFFPPSVAKIDATQTPDHTHTRRRPKQGQTPTSAKHNKTDPAGAGRSSIIRCSQSWPINQSDTT